MPTLTPSSTRARYAPATLSLAVGLLMVACGPPKAVDGSGDETSTGDGDPDPTAGTTTSMDPTGPDPSDSDDGLPSTGWEPDVICDCQPSCEPFMQDCPEGEKCVPYPSTGGGVPDAPRCVPVFGELPPGSPCTMEDPLAATDDCDVSSVCWDRVDGVHGICRAFCQGSPEQPVCGEGEVCLQAYEESTAVCVAGCDPLLQDCAEGLGCHWSGSEFACVVTLTDPRTQTGAGAGEPCGFLSDCDPGLDCVDAERLPECAIVSCCSPYCDTSLGDAECAALPGTTCVAFFEEGQAPPAWVTLGLCVAA